jgi:hypothetical protein
MRCTQCKGKGTVPAPPTNSWVLFFKAVGESYHVSVPCRACGGIDGDANRQRLRERLAARKAAGAFSCDVPR